MSLLDEGASFADLNVSRIAERAGRTRTAFYAHFEDRRHLLLALLERFGGDTLAALQPFLAADGPISYADIEASTRAAFETFRKNATLIRAATEAAGYDDEVADYWSSTVDQIIEGSQQRLLAEGLDAEHARATATALAWMSERLTYQQVVREATDLDDEAAAAAISHVWWSSLHAASQGKP